MNLNADCCFLIEENLSPSVSVSILWLLEELLFLFQRVQGGEKELITSPRHFDIRLKLGAVT